MAAAPELPCGDPPRARRGGEEGKGGWGCVRGGGRSGARGEGSGGCVWGGDHSIRGWAAWSPLITQPRGALWTCQSRLERWCGKPQKGSVCLGADQEIASGAAMLGLRETALGAPPACMSTGMVFRPSLLVVLHAGEDGVWGHLLLWTRPSLWRASEIQGAHSRNS